jgi:hypothetical protein
MREHDAKIEAELAILKPIADTDRSGFVSSAEGWSFSHAMEFGARAAFIYEDLEHDRGRLLEALRLTEERFQKKAEEYHYYLDLLPSYQKEPFLWLEWARLDDDDAAR